LDINKIHIIKGTTTKMKIAVASTNPVKIKAVTKIAKKLWPKAIILSMDTDSGVSSMPTSDDECITGATNRAKAILKKTGADYGVGIEGGTTDTKYGMFLTGWTVVASKDGRLSLGSSGRLIIPKIFRQKVLEGEELGPAADRLVGTTNIKQKEGVVGLLTKNLLTREDALAVSVANAFARFISEEYFNM
jgi:inosine/xanthosine triphosphatase